MHRLLKTITQTLSVRISLMVVFAMAILLMASLTAMLHYSKRVVKEEALNKAVQILDATVLRIDNILLSVEQSTGNIFFSLMANLDNPDVMFDYSRKLVEANPYVAGCAIAFKENFFKDRQYFMAYVYRSDGDTLSYRFPHHSVGNLRECPLYGASVVHYPDEVRQARVAEPADRVRRQY